MCVLIARLEDCDTSHRNASVEDEPHRTSCPLVDDPYRCGANLSPEHGYAQRFDTFRETWEASTNEIDKTRLITETGIERIGNLPRRGRPFFVWLHYVNPHGPYTPPADYARPFLTDRYFDPRALVAGAPYPPGDDAFVESEPRLAPYVANYDGEIAFADAEIGRLLDFLSEQPSYEDTLVVMTADHGENLGEWGCYFMHGPKLTEATLRVPLIFSQPGRVARARVAAPVQLIDVAPTILDWVGASSQAQPASPLAGESLVGLDPKSTTSPHAYLFFASNEYWGLRRRNIKLVMQAVKRVVYPGPQVRMFDLGTDPAELHDNYPTQEPSAERLIEVLQRRRALQDELIDTGLTRYEDLSEAARENLRSLRYIH